MTEQGYIPMPCDVFLYLSDFIGDHEIDIIADIEDFGLLAPVRDWINELAGALEDSRTA